LFVAAAMVLAASLVPAGMAEAAAKDQHVRLLAINDFHGHLAPDTPGSIQTGCCKPVIDSKTGAQTGWTQTTVPAGGIAYLAAHMKALRKHHPHAIGVSAGDTIGASPLISGLFHDEPAIEGLNTLGLSVNGVGNHEFDEGIDELYRMQYGKRLGGDGCHPVDGCPDDTPFSGAFFKYLAANVFFEGTNRTIFPPYWIRTVGGTKIAFIGMTFEATPTVVTPTGVAGLEFRPEVATANTLVGKLKKQGVKAFVVLLHQGGAQRPPAPPPLSGQPKGDEYTDVNKCVNFNGPEITNIASQLDPAIGVVVSAHTHQPYVCHLGGKLVTSAASFGRLITSIDLTINKKSKSITDATATNHIVTQTVKPDPKAQAVYEKWKALAAPKGNAVIGKITADIRSARDTPSGQNDAGEQPMGDVIADAMLEATSPTDFGGAKAAFMNSGGVRAGLLYARSPGGEAPGDVTYGEAFDVQPFGNTLVVKTCTGQQIYDVLNQQFNNPAAGSNRIMLPSGNVRYAWTTVGGPHVVDGTVSFDKGATFIDKAASYRVAMNNFMADGGDGYTVFRNCTNPLGGEVDLDAFARYLGAHSPVAPPALERITKAG
jgi:5'-nucleotidase